MTKTITEALGDRATEVLDLITRHQQGFVWVEVQPKEGDKNDQITD